MASFRPFPQDFAGADTGLQGLSPESEPLAIDVVAALQAYERTLNAAVIAGLVVEPSFERVRGRLPGVEESCVAKLSIFRRPHQTGFPRHASSLRMADTETGGD